MLGLELDTAMETSKIPEEKADQARCFIAIG